MENKYKRFIEFWEKNKDLIKKKFKEVNEMNYPCNVKSLEDLTYDARVPGGMPGPEPLSQMPVGPGNIENYLSHKIPDIKELDRLFIESLKKKAEVKQDEKPLQ